MTKHVRNGYRKHRKTTWVAVVALVALVALAVALPALAADRFSEPTTPEAVVPTLVNVGGSNFSCTTDTTGQPSGMSTFKINQTPSSATTANYNVASGVTLSVTGVSGRDAGKKFSFSISGATVFHVGVLGGSKNAWYDYTTKGGVTSDGDLHATTNNQGQLYNTSYTTFCWARTTTISGRVYLDNDGNGSYGESSTPADAGLNGWSVSLYRTSSPAGQVGSAKVTPSPTSAGAGLFTFTGVPLGSNYKVCVAPPANSGTWSQSQPTGTACSSESSAAPAGQTITDLQAPATDVNFGVEKTVAASCGTTFSADLIGTGTGIVEYRAQLTAPLGTIGPCKGFVVMYSYLDNGAPFAVIHPPSSSTDTRPFWVVERIRWKVDEGGAQNPVTLQYDDSPPYGDGFTVMKMCTADPRPDGQLFQTSDPATVMPSASDTTCMIQSTDLPSAASYNYEAYTVSTVDGLKGVG